MRVILYKNLIRRDWSLAVPSGRAGTGRGKVIDHRKTIILANVTFRVIEATRLRVVANKKREVHAWAIGDIVEFVPSGMIAYEVTYSPFRCGEFTTRDGIPIRGCAYVEFTESHGVIAYAGGYVNDDTAMVSENQIRTGR